MQPIKTFAIFKNEKKLNPESPDYNISVKIGDKFIRIAGGWIKESKGGSKFISCKFSNAWGDNKSYGIVEDAGTTISDEDKARISALREGAQTKEAVSNDISVSEIPFR